MLECEFDLQRSAGYTVDSKGAIRNSLSVLNRKGCLYTLVGVYIPDQDACLTVLRPWDKSSVYNKGTDSTSHVSTVATKVNLVILDTDGYKGIVHVYIAFNQRPDDTYFRQG